MARKSEIIGVSKAVRNIDRKDQSLKKRFVADCRDAANMARDAGKATTLFSDKTGTLRKAIRTKLAKNRKGKVRFKVGVDAAKARHGWLVEHGHNLVRAGRRVGRVEARHYMLEAFEATRIRMYNRIRDGARTAMNA